MNYKNQWLFGFFLVLGCTGDDAGSDGAGSDTGSSGGTASTAPGDDGATDGSTSDGADDVTTMPDDTTGDPPADSSGDDPTTGDPTAESGSESDSTGGIMGGTVSGTVFRDPLTQPAPGNDAIGDIYIGLLASCAANGESLASGMVMDGDLSDPDVGVPYSIEDVPDGTYYAVAFMDDNDNVDPKNIDADMGDLAAAEGFGPACVTVVVVGGVGVMDADITLNIVVPF